LITLGATIVTGVQNMVAKHDLLSRASECVGQLGALLIELQFIDVDTVQVEKQYQALLLVFEELEL
jgi:hypothetical protein